MLRQLKSWFRKKTSILIVEDDDETAALLAMFLKPHGYDTICAKDGNEGLKMMEMSRPDLVLLDIMMPGLSGFDVLLQIKSQPKTKRVPVIMCTALNDIKDVERCYNWGADGYITKPFELNRILEKISSALN
jgi:DNA-binding response OmpR family regulator